LTALLGFSGRSFAESGGEAVPERKTPLATFKESYARGDLGRDEYLPKRDGPWTMMEVSFVFQRRIEYLERRL
jgi:hypothetical protein